MQTMKLGDLEVGTMLVAKILDTMMEGRPVLLTGPAGVGKTMLSRRLAKLRGGDAAPFRAPHHTVSMAGMTGNRRNPKGEISLADRGTLFLDELPEFRRETFDAVRVALREGEITHYDHETDTTIHVPTRFSLIMTANLCACGWQGFMVGGADVSRCKCSASQIARYRERTLNYSMAVEAVEIQIYRPQTRVPLVLLAGEWYSSYLARA